MCTSGTRVEAKPGPVEADPEHPSGAEEMLERVESGGVAVEDCDSRSTVNEVLTAVTVMRGDCVRGETLRADPGNLRGEAKGRRANVEIGGNLTHSYIET